MTTRTLLDESLVATLFLASACVPASESNAAESVDGAPPAAWQHPPYEPGTALAGELTAIGSDSMFNLIVLWEREFQARHPGLVMNVQGQGSTTAVPALLEGRSQIGPMTRLMSADEVARFAERYGYEPTPVPVAIDALAVFVHVDNPLDRLTLQQVDAIFSSTRQCGYADPIDRWGRVVQRDGWTDAPIEAFGRGSNSGTHGFFREHALCGGEFADRVLELASSADVVRQVAMNEHAVGYAGITYATPEVKALTISRAPGEPFYTSASAAIYNSQHPLSRLVYLYVNKAPDTPLEPRTLEFVRFVLSLEGQEQVIKDGWTPLPADVAERELAKLLR